MLMQFQVIVDRLVVGFGLPGPAAVWETTEHARRTGDHQATPHSVRDRRSAFGGGRGRAVPSLHAAPAPLAPTPVPGRRTRCSPDPSWWPGPSRPGRASSTRSTSAAGSEIYLPLRPEGPSWVSVFLVDYACAATTTLATFPISCSRLGDTKASGEVAERVLRGRDRKRAPAPGLGAGLGRREGRGGHGCAVRGRPTRGRCGSNRWRPTRRTRGGTWINYPPGADVATVSGTVAGSRSSGSNVRPD